MRRESCWYRLRGSPVPLPAASVKVPSGLTWVDSTASSTSARCSFVMRRTGVDATSSSQTSSNERLFATSVRRPERALNSATPSAITARIVSNGTVFVP